MITSGRSSAGSFSVGAYTSNDCINWTAYGANPIFSPSGVAGTWDYGSVAVRTVLWDAATALWHIFYEGFGTAGYEVGVSCIGHATAPVLLGPWTRDQANPIATRDQIPGIAGGAQLYLPCVRKDAGIWYMFFNAGAAGDEDVYRYKAASIDGPWAYDGKAADNGGVGGGILADPWIINIDGVWWMYTWNSVGGVVNIHYAESLGGTWEYHGNMTYGGSITGYRPTIVQVGGRILCYLQDTVVQNIDLFVPSFDAAVLLNHSIFQARYQLDCGNDWGTFDILSSGARRYYSALNTGGSLATIGVASGAVGAEVDKPILVMPTTGGDPYFPNNFRLGSATGPRYLSGEGSPEGAVIAPVGSIYTRTDGGAGATLYVKETGTGNTGWVAK